MALLESSRYNDRTMPISIYIDGACNMQTRQGGWGAVLEQDGLHVHLSASEHKTTNQRMEVAAAINALEATPPGSTVTVTSDSEYLVKTMTAGWKRKANTDLWSILDTLAAARQVTWHWVRGHEGHDGNEEANALAQWRAGTGPKPGPCPLEQSATPEQAPALSPARLTHLDEQGRAAMVDVSAKPETEREAIAKGAVVMRPETLALIRAGQVKKGDVLATARIAGVMAAKQTASLIPLCHPLPVSYVGVDLELDERTSSVLITATARTVGRTGVEMEALTAVTVAALTVYDMCKSADRAMHIQDVRLVAKRGGKSGDLLLE